MDLLGLLLFATLAGSAPVQDSVGFPGSDAWRETWRELDALSRSAPGSVERRRIHSELTAFQARHERAARKRHDRPEVFRARVLEAHLARLADTPFRPVADPGVPIAWLPGEGWIAAQVAAPGPTRVAAIETALLEATPVEVGARVAFAMDLAAADARDLRLDEARTIAEAACDRLRSAAPDELPSALRGGARAVILLARVARLKGEYGEAVAFLQPVLEVTTDPVDRYLLLVEAGCARLAAREDGRAQRDLAEALALGSSEACWLLGRAALSEGAIPRSRALFRSLISSPDKGRTPTPAWRGYGLSLLADAGSDALSTRNPPDTPR